MSIRYVERTVTAGSGSGTLGDPWNLQDTFSSANTNGIAAGDTIALIVDPVNDFTTSTLLYSPITNFSVVPVDASGNLSFFRAKIDGASISSGAMFSANKNGPFFFGVELNNGPGDGWFISAGDNQIFMNCGANDNASRGFYNSSGARSNLYVFCDSQGNGGNGFQSLEGSNPELCLFCFFDDNDYTYHKGSCFFSVFKDNLKANSYSVLGATSIVQVFGFNTIAETSKKNDASNRYGLGTTGTSQNQAAVFNVFENLFNDGSGETKAWSGTGGGGIDCIFGNIVTNTDGLTFAGQVPSGLNENDAVTDPGIVSVSGGNLQNGTNMVGDIPISSVSNESGWVEPGALSSRLNAALPADDIYDYTTFTEVDPNSEITIEATRITVANLDSRFTTAYVVGAILGDVSDAFTFRYSWDISEMDNESAPFLFGLSTAVDGDLLDCMAGSAVCIVHRLYRDSSGDVYELLGKWLATGSDDANQLALASFATDGTRYYTELKRVGTLITAKTYTGSDFSTGLVASRQITVSGITEYSYVYGFSSYDDDTNNGVEFSGHMYDLTMLAPGGGGGGGGGLLVHPGMSGGFRG